MKQTKNGLKKKKLNKNCDEENKYCDGKRKQV